MRIRNSLIATAIAGAFCMSAMTAFATPSAQDFVTKASIANEFEIESSTIALQKSQNDDVKQFAQQMVDDHTKTAQSLKDTLSSQTEIQPAEQLDSKHQKMIDKLNKLSGKDFDSKYISYQTDAHKDAVKLFTDYSKHGDNQALKDFAGQTLPTLKDHLRHVKQLSDNQ